MTTMFESAKEQYAKLGIDVEAVMDKLAQKAISVHCWQGDDVLGFDQEGGLSGGIQTTGNYPGRARNFEELKADFEESMSMVPGTKRIALHASYAIFTDEPPGSIATRSRTPTSNPGSNGPKSTDMASISTPLSSVIPR